MAGASCGVVRMMLLCEGSHEGSRCGSVLLRRFGFGKATARAADEMAPARVAGGVSAKKPGAKRLLQIHAENAEGCCPGATVHTIKAYTFDFIRLGLRAESAEELVCQNRPR